jgi:hypothetical protein
MRRLIMGSLLALVLSGMAWSGIAVGAAAAPVITNHPREASSGAVTAAGWESSNWSGYAVTGNAPYTAVTDTWVVPTVSPTAGATYSSSWVGIDGFNDDDLIQTGTEQDYYHGSAHYSAWWEILPAAETEITSITVRPGNVMKAAITRGSGSLWTIAIDDTTSGASFTTVRSYRGPASSAEWIEEAPTVGNNVATLAHYGKTAFNPLTARGVDPELVSSEAGVMVQHGVQVSTPSVPDPARNGFAIAYGSSQPPPPSS